MEAWEAVAQAVAGQGAQSIDTPPLKLHRAFVGRSGEFRAGPVDPRFEQLFDDLRGQTSQLRSSRCWPAIASTGT
jgi:hypothetical protein